MAKGNSNISLPAAVGKYLADATAALSSRKLERLRVAPLLLRLPLASLLARRKRIFTTADYKQTPFGYEVSFARHLKRSKQNPEGRTVDGKFDILSISQDIALVASSLGGDDNRNGPLRFSEKAYPLGRRPFFPSTALARLIEDYASSREWTPVCQDAKGLIRNLTKLQEAELSLVIVPKRKAK